MRAAAKASLRHGPGKRPAQHLATLVETAPHEFEQVSRRRGWRVVADDVDERRLHVGAGHEHAGGHGAGEACRGPVRRLHADRAVGRAARIGGQPFRHLPLHHDEHVVDGGDLVEKVGDERSGDVVGEVGDERPARRTGEQRPPVELHRIAVDDAHVVAIGHDLVEHRHEVVVDLDSDDAGTRLGEGECQRAHAGTDLHDVVAFADRGELGDAAHRVRVGDEVLTELAPRVAADAIEQFADRRTGVGHRRISTGTGASAALAIDRYVLRSSTITPGSGLMRSVSSTTTHVADRLLLTLVIVRVDPTGAGPPTHIPLEAKALLKLARARLTSPSSRAGTPTSTTAELLRLPPSPRKMLSASEARSMAVRRCSGSETRVGDRRRCRRFAPGAVAGVVVALQHPQGGQSHERGAHRQADAPSVSGAELQRTLQISGSPRLTPHPREGT